MKRSFSACLAAVCLTVPVAAQDAQDGTSLMERGAQQFLEGLLREMEPALDGMKAFVDEMGPAMVELLDQIEDWSVYEPPEILENGDIIIRRKPDPDTRPDPEIKPEPMPQIEL